ncbi:MAG: hypothetical protein LC792_24120, partial [Actinobacteria bacterium]|nr:hypothetical protein [Actinomycetota bacterium]
MTQLLDRPIAGASTLYPRHPVPPAGLRAAEDFYLQGQQPMREIAIQVSGPDASLRRTWLASHMEQQINALLRLRSGWDGRRALPPTDAAVRSAVGL